MISILERLKSTKEIERNEKIKVNFKSKNLDLIDLDGQQITSRHKNITKRDLGILRFITKFGYVYIEHIEQAFNLNKSSRRAYQLLSKLKTMGLIKAKRVFYKAPELIFLTKKGNDKIGSKPPRKIALATLEHDLNVIYFYLALRDKYKNHDIITDRELLRDNYKIGNKGHRPDLLIIGDDDYIAVEVELSIKTTKRLRNIKNYYLDHSEYTKVLYLCNKTTYNYINKFFSNFNMFEVIRITNEK